MIPGVNIISGKTSTASVNGTGGSGGHAVSPYSGNFRVQSTLRKFIGSKEHLDWLKIDLNPAEKITVPGYKRTKN